MKTDLYTKQSTNSWMKIVLYLPHVILSKSHKHDFGGSYKESEVSLDTRITIRSSMSIFLFEVVILGFGLGITLKESK